MTTESVFKHDYVRLGFFQQDDLERHFGYFRRSAGCNYFVTTKEVFATHSMDRAREMLKFCEEDDMSDVPSSHVCDLCSHAPVLGEKEVSILQELPEKVEDISHDDSLNLMYMASYVAFKHPRLRGNKEDFDDNFTAFLNEMDRGKLSYPSEELFCFTRLAFLYFTTTPDKLCRKGFILLMAEFPSYFNLDIFLSSEPLPRIANLFFKRFSKNVGQNVYAKSRKTQSQSASLAKLSSKSSK